MHLYKFSSAQKNAFLSLALKLIVADDKLRAAEVAHLESICREMGIDRGVAQPDRPVDELLAVFDTRAARVWLMLEILGVGYVDQHFSHEEAALINEIVERFQFGEGEIGTMKNIVLRGKGLEIETERLIGQET